MEFGRKLLSKFGWEEGKGLGKSENGIVAPLKPKLKFDSTGIGFDYSKEYVNDWWAQSYNEALQKVDVSKKSSKKKRIAEDLKEATNQKKTKNFIKTETLLQDGSHVPEPDIHCKTVKDKETSTLDYNKLFELCGGRTAHKGARHGLGLSGKLARLEAQEKRTGYSSQQASEVSSTKKDSDLPNNGVKCANKRNEDLRSKELGKSIKAKSNVFCLVSEQFSENCEEGLVFRKKKKKRKSDKDPTSEDSEVSTKTDISKRRKIIETEEPFVELENALVSSKSKKKSKKNKKIKIVCES